MKLYCSNCGLHLNHRRKAIKELGIVVDSIDVHVCADEPVPFNLSSLSDPCLPIEGKDKFVLGLNDLKLPQYKTTKVVEGHLGNVKQFKGVGTDDLRDRRFEGAEVVKTTAPNSVLDQIKSMTNSIPVHDELAPKDED